MAETAEDFANDLLMKIFGPIAIIAGVIFVVKKILGFVWQSFIVPNAIPVLWGTGILFSLGIICFILFMRAGKNAAAWKSFVFALLWFGIFGVVVYLGNSDKLPWAQRIVDSMSWVIAHPIVACVIVVVGLIIAVTIPIHGLGSSQSTIKKELIRGFEAGMRGEGQENS